MKKEIKKMYRAKGLALHIGVGLSTVWRWAKEGKIKAYKISDGITVFDIEEVMSDLGLSASAIETRVKGA
jgi:predicted site-specific integrase-resolvase